MANNTVLAVKTREAKAPKGELRSRRAEGIIPAVVYGGKGKPENLWVSRKDLENAIHKAHSSNVLFDLQFDEKSAHETALLKSIQKHLLYSHPIHVDFYRVDINHKVDVEVAVRLTGEAKGVKNQGGILEHLLREVRVRCLPTAIP